MHLKQSKSIHPSTLQTVYLCVSGTRARTSVRQSTWPRGAQRSDFQHLSAVCFTQGQRSENPHAQTRKLLLAI